MMVVSTVGSVVWVQTCLCEEVVLLLFFFSACVDFVHGLVRHADQLETPCPSVISCDWLNTWNLLQWLIVLYEICSISCLCRGFCHCTRKRQHRQRRRHPPVCSMLCHVWSNGSKSVGGNIDISSGGESPSTVTLNSATSGRCTWSSGATPGKTGSHSIASVNWVERRGKKKAACRQENRKVMRRQ